jgi:hypothetical protein
MATVSAFFFSGRAISIVDAQVALIQGGGVP